MEELHVVGVARVRKYQMPLVSDLHEIWQVVIVGVAVVEEATFLDQQTSGVHRAGRPCVPAEGRVPVTAFVAATVRAMRSRSSASSRSACPSQRQPWAETSWPRRTASCASSGSRSTARPLELTVAGAPCWPSTSMIRHQPAREPYSKWLSIAGSG